MPKHVDDGGCTAPAGRYGTTDTEHRAYIGAHSAGWTHGNYVAAYGAGGGTVEKAAQRYASDNWAGGTNEWARAVEGFVDGAEAFDENDSDD